MPQLIAPIKTGTRRVPLNMSIATAMRLAEESGMAVWCRPAWRNGGAYHVYPGGRIDPHCSPRHIASEYCPARQKTANPAGTPNPGASKVTCG